MADVFAASGYRTGMFGKWHLGEHYSYRPHDRGFHEAIYHGNGAIGTTGDVWGNDYFDDTYQHNGRPKKYSGYCTDVWFREASRFIRESHAHGDPFFCYLSTNLVHGPLLVADEYFLRYRDVKGVFSRNAAKMYGMVANLDKNMGRLMRLLKSESLDRDTILIFILEKNIMSKINRGSILLSILALLVLCCTAGADNAVGVRGPVGCGKNAKQVERLQITKPGVQRKCQMVGYDNQGESKADPFELILRNGWR